MSCTAIHHLQTKEGRKERTSNTSLEVSKFCKWKPGHSRSGGRSRQKEVKNVGLFFCLLVLVKVSMRKIGALTNKQHNRFLKKN